MKHSLKYAVLITLLSAVLFTACAYAADNRPMEIRSDGIDLNSGTSDASASPGEIPVWQFFHAASAEELETAVITGTITDCESGPIPCEVTEDEAKSIRMLALYGVVTGRESDMMVTGGTRLFTFETPAGEYLMTIEMYMGHLVGNDGMYNYQIRQNGEE